MTKKTLIQQATIALMKAGLLPPGHTVYRVQSREVTPIDNQYGFNRCRICREKVPIGDRIYVFTSRFGTTGWRQKRYRHVCGKHLET